MVERLIKVLTYTETQAITAIFDTLNGVNKVITVSAIADKTCITRSVFIEAQKLLEAAGVIRTISLGRKGTYIEILELEAFKEVADHGRFI